MAFSPNNLLYLCKGTRLDSSYQNTYSFDDKSKQENFFESKIKITYEMQTLFRNTSEIKVNLTIAECHDIDYLFYINNDFDGKIFYYFVNGAEIINDNVTKLHIELDYIQTWYFETDFNYCYIERKHVTDDTIGANLLPENLDIGDYISTRTAQIPTDTLDMVVIVTEVLEGLESYFNNPSIIGGNYTGGYWSIMRLDANGVAQMKFILDMYAQGKNEAIVSIFAIDTNFTSRSSTTKTTILDIPPLTLSTNVKNNKCKTFPYVGVELQSNSNGVVLKYEDMNENTVAIEGGFGANAKLIMYPTQYKGVYNDIVNGVSISNYPLIPFVQDYYQNYIARNGDIIANQQNQNIFGTIVGGLNNLVGGAGNVATGNVLGGLSSGLSLVNTLGQGYFKNTQINLEVERHKMIPDTFNGSVNAGDVTLLSGLSPFKLNCKCIKPEFLKKVDDYFTMYGYKVNMLEIPILKTRQSWNFLKMSECNIKGSFNNIAKNKIKSIYENGITLWHGDYVGDYSLENEVIT